MNDTSQWEERVMVYALERDGPLTCRVLAEVGFHTHNCSTAQELAEEIPRGAAALIVAVEVLQDDVLANLQGILARQPAWADLPIIIITNGDPPRDSLDRLVRSLGNAAVLNRPLELPTLSSSVGTALRARRRQYQIRDLLDQRDEANRRKDEFLAMLAHELRNPLAPIRSAAEILGLKAKGDPSLTRIRDIISRQVGHMARMVDDLLDVSRISRGKIALKKEILDLGEALAALIAGLAASAADRKIGLSFAPPTDPILIEADPTRLEQMVGNALTNAFKFTPEGGFVTVRAVREGRFAVIRVRDTGIGISPAMQEKVFELFAQTERQLDRSQGGLGIGLTVLRALAELHGGSAELQSDGEGQGTEVVICIPALPPRAKAASAPESTGVSNEAPRRVMVIDDNVDAAETLALLLAAHGHEVDCAFDGFAALEAAKRRPPEFAICDIGLPRLDGYELVKRFRADPVLRNCICIAVTGYGEERDRLRALEAGFDQHFKKPANPNDLLGLIAATDRRGRPLRAH